MKKFGLAYDDLRAVRADIILCEFSSYGEEGPLAHIGANDLALQAHSGLMSITGEADRPPVRCGTSIIDLHGSLALVIAMMAALIHRMQTGEGQIVDTSLLRSSAHLMNYFYGEYWAKGVIRKPMGTANHLSVPNQVFPTADGSVVIIAPSDEMWRRCAAALDAELLDRDEWRTILDRQRHRAEVIEAVTAVTLGMSSDEIMERLGNAKVNVAKVNNIGQAADHPQLAAVGGVLEFDLDGRNVKAVASPFALHGVPHNRIGPPEARRAYGRDPARARILRERSASAARRRRIRQGERPRAPAARSSIHRNDHETRKPHPRRPGQHRGGHARAPAGQCHGTRAAWRAHLGVRRDDRPRRRACRGAHRAGQGVLRRRRHQGTHADDRRAGEYGALNRLVREMFYSILECSKPVIAAVQGPALGAGMALVLCCDILLASEDAVFAHARGRRGLAGGVKFLQRHLTPSKARRMLLTGQRVPAAELYRLGVLEECVPAGALHADRAGARGGDREQEPARRAHAEGVVQRGGEPDAARRLPVGAEHDRGAVAHRGRDARRAPRSSRSASRCSRER